MAYKIAGVPRAMTLCDHDVQRRCSPRANNLLQRRRHGGSLREHPADGGRRRRRTVRRGHRTRVSRTHRICAREALQCVLQDRPHIPAQHRFIAKHLRCRKESRRKQRRVRHAQIVEHTHRGIAAAADQARQNSSAVLWERYTFMGKHDTVPRPWKSVRGIRSMEPTFMTAVLADGKQHPQALPPLRAGKTSARPLISLIYQAKREVYPAGVIAFRGGAAHTGRHRFCHDKEGRKRS